MSKPFVEYNREYFCGVVISSDVRPATELEVQQAMETYAATKQCDHSIVVDDHGWMYDYRFCHICGKGPGVV